MSEWKPRPWQWIGAGVGALASLFDAALVVVLGVDMQIGGLDATAGVLTFVGITYIGVGYGMGQSMQERARARRDAEIIASQLRELERTQRDLVQQEKLAAIGRVAAGVAHEVRNPLGVIRASAAMVQESFEPGEDPYRACGFICEEIDRLNSLITSLLTLSRPTELRSRTLSLEKVVERAIALAGEDLRARKIEVEREVESAGAEISGDPDLLCQLVYGLVSNASEALPAGGRIVVRTQRLQDCVRVEVADSGTGVEPDDAAHLFEPFFTTKATGTGLGLPMAERIAQAHHGSLEFVSGAGLGPEGQGACFRLDLPTAVAA